MRHRLVQSLLATEPGGKKRPGSEFVVSDMRPKGRVALKFMLDCVGIQLSRSEVARQNAGLGADVTDAGPKGENSDDARQRV